MPDNAPSERYEKAKERLADGDVSERERDAILTMAENLNKSTSTKGVYLRCLRLFAEWLEGDLVDLSPAELDAQYKDRADARDAADSTRGQYQSALRAFVREHYDEDAAEQIDVNSGGSDPSINPRTVLNPDEYHSMREKASKDRDRAVLDFFAYTGQRLRVIQTLSYGDVDIENGVYYMPEGVEGLKGADKHGKKRPLLGSRKALSDWMDAHPTKDPNDALFTCDPENPGGATPGTQLGASTIQRIPERLAERAGVEKPVNPHAWRHFFVTIAKTQYDMDDGTIKWLIGHSQGSKIMQTTYSHLSDDDHIADAREAMGLDADDEETTTAPPVCPTCNRPLPPSAESCPTPTCTERFVPGSADAEIQDAAATVAGATPEDREQFLAEMESALTD